MSGMCKENYTVYAFMIERGLRGAELLVYALIYSYTRDGGRAFYGSQEHIADRTGLSLRSVQRALLSLTEGGHLEKRSSKNGKRVRYLTLTDS